MSIVRNFNLYLNAGNGSVPYINVNQYDQGEQWVFTLYKEDGTKYLPSTGAIVGIKADNRGIINTGTVDADGRVVINETQQMTAAAGIAIFELLIDGDSHGTANFLVNVEQRPGDNADLSDSDLSLIQQAVDSAEVIVEVIGDSDPSEVIGEHVDAWLDNHPEATTTVQDGAITAPKINNSLWDKLLVSEEASGAVASFADGADGVPVSSLKVNLEPIQTGTGDPSPSNIRPIVASNGKNMMPSGVDGTYTKTGITCIAKNGIYKLTGTSTAITDIQIPLTESADLTPTNKKLAFLNTENNGNSLSVDVYRDSTRVHYWTMNSVNRVVSGWTDTGNETINKIVFHVSSGVTVNSTISPMLMLLSDDDYSYRPYQGIMVERVGKNLLDPSLLTVFSQTYVSTVNYNTVGLIAVAPSTAYTISFASGVGDGRIYQYDASGNAIGSALQFTLQPYTFTTNANCKTIGFRYKFTNESATVADAKAQLELGTTATDYEPYTGTSYPYTLGRSVYGGTVDLATGVLTVDRAIVDLSTLTWTWSSDRYVGTKPTGIKTNANIIAEKYAPWGVNPTQGIKMNSSYNLWCVTGDGNTPTGQMVYELAIPTTVQLTPQEVKTLLGYNNISSSGTVDVIYHADTKLYVDKMTAVDNAIIAPTEADFVATRNYTVNDLVIVNDTLYKVTSNIASGSTITPNSNVTQTTLSALIKALS